MIKNFYVCDSFHTENIADAIRRTFPGSTVYTDSTIASVPPDGADPIFGLQSILIKNVTEKIQKKDKVPVKIDFFILSAKLIDDKSVKPEQLKLDYGNSDSKTIAVSMMSHFLEKVKGRVDYTEDKEVFLDEQEIKDFFSKIN